MFVFSHGCNIQCYKLFEYVECLCAAAYFRVSLLSVVKGYTPVSHTPLLVWLPHTRQSHRWCSVTPSQCPSWPGGHTGTSSSPWHLSNAAGVGDPPRRQVHHPPCTSQHKVVMQTQGTPHLPTCLSWGIHTAGRKSVKRSIVLPSRIKKKSEVFLKLPVTKQSPGTHSLDHLGT